MLMEMRHETRKVSSISEVETSIKKHSKTICNLQEK
jgi:hypothetical protein